MDFIDYYLVFIVDFNDDTKKSVSIYSYDTLDEAEASWHTNTGGWMKKENVGHILSFVVNSDGKVYDKKSWYRGQAAD